jgi:alpha-1,2-mannosyltransferase
VDNPAPASLARTLTRVVTVLAVIAVVIAGHLWYGNRHDYFDLRIYYGAVVDWAHGGKLYDFAVQDRYAGPLGFTYPPFAALLMYPMSWVSVHTAISAMWLASAVALALMVSWLVIPLADRHGWPRWYVIGIALPLATWLEPVRETITFGQINLILAALVVWDLLFLARRGSRWAGVAIGLAAAIKLTPAIFIVYALLTRRFRLAATAVGAAVVATGLAAALSFGDSWQYWTSVLWDTSRVGDVKKTPNQSLEGALSRLLDPHKAPGWLWLALVLVVLGAGMSRAVRAYRNGDEVVGLTLTGLVGALVSPVSWQHHLVWFIPAIVVLADAGLTRGRAGRGRVARAGYLVAAAGVWATVSYSVIAWYDWGLVPRHMIHTPWGNVIAAWDTLLMLALLAVLPIRQVPAGEPAPRLLGRPWRATRPTPTAGTPARPPVEVTAGDHPV